MLLETFFGEDKKIQINNIKKYCDSIKHEKHDKIQVVNYLTIYIFFNNTERKKSIPKTNNNQNQLRAKERKRNNIY